MDIQVEAPEQVISRDTLLEKYAKGDESSIGEVRRRVARALGTYLHGPLLPRNPWLADLLLSWALAHASGGDPPTLEPLPDELEHVAHDVAARRARSRGGRF